jgi:hypothetical protein
MHDDNQATQVRPSDLIAAGQALLIEIGGNRNSRSFPDPKIW